MRYYPVGGGPFSDKMWLARTGRCDRRADAGRHGSLHGHAAVEDARCAWSITLSRARLSAVVSAVRGSYFNAPKMQRAIVATSASRGQRAMAKVSGTSTRCRFVSANSCSVFITHPPASLGDLAEHSLHHALELDFNEFGKD